MALNLDSLLMQLRPGPGLDLSGMMRGIQQGQQMGMERQQLALQRQQFEETKRRNREDERLRLMSEQGEARRMEMQAEQAKAKLAADAEAERMKSATGAYNDFYKATDARDFSGMDAAASRLRTFGGVAQSLGLDAQGRPSYRLGLSAEEDAKLQAQRDAQSAERPLESGAEDESLDTSLDRLGALGHDTTTEGVVDAGALIDQSRSQLVPFLEKLRAGLPPGAYRDSVTATDDALVQLGQNPLASFEMRLKAQKPNDDIISGTIDDQRDDARLQLDREKFEWEKGKTGQEKPLTRKDIQQLRNYGERDAAEPYKNRLIKDRLTIGETAQQARDLLKSGNRLNHEKVVNLLMELNKQVGSQSERDADRMTGEDKASFMQRVSNFITQWTESGYAPEQVDALLEFTDRLAASNEAEIDSYISDMAKAQDDEDDEDVRKGIWGFVQRNVPSHVLKRYDERQKAENPEEHEEPQGASATPIRFNMEEDAERYGAPGAGPAASPKKQARLEDDPEFMASLEMAAKGAKLDPSLILPQLNYESGGNPHAENKSVSSEGVKSSAKGIIQMLDENAQRYGFADSAELAALPASQQAPVAIQYLVDSGITSKHDAGDIYVAIAAPAALKMSNDTIVYRADAGTAKERANYELNAKNWDTNGDGVITRGEIHALGMQKWKASRRAEGPGLSRVGQSEARPGPAAARARAQVGPPAEEEAEDALPEATPDSVAGIRERLGSKSEPTAKPAASKPAAHDDETRSLFR